MAVTARAPAPYRSTLGTRAALTPNHAYGNTDTALSVVVDDWWLGAPPSTSPPSNPTRRPRRGRRRGGSGIT